MSDGRTLRVGCIMMDQEVGEVDGTDAQHLELLEEWHSPTWSAILHITMEPSWQWSPMKMSWLTPRTMGPCTLAQWPGCSLQLKWAPVAYTSTHICVHEQLPFHGELQHQVWLLFCRQQLPSLLLQLVQLLELSILTVFLTWLYRDG